MLKKLYFLSSEFVVYVRDYCRGGSTVLVGVAGLYFSQNSQRRPALAGVGTGELVARLCWPQPRLFVRSGFDSGRACQAPPSISHFF